MQRDISSTELPSPTAAAQPSERLFAGRIATGGEGLRRRAARGTLVNGAYQFVLISLGFLRGLVVAAFLSTSDYGVWGILVVSLGTMLWLKQAGIGDKYVQQSEQDQSLAFQRAFTLELVFSAGFAVLFAAVLPVFALVYGQSEIVAPGLLMALSVPLGALQSPIWVYWRRMEFIRQRFLQAIDPVLGFVVTLALAVAGAGYWSLVVGTLAGSLAAGAAAVAYSPYPLRLRYERGIARAYLSFSWPLVIAGASSLVIAQGSIIAGEHELGLAGVGAITLAATIAHYSDRVDAVLTETIYPAICAVQDRTEALFETFVKSNRLALIWGLPFGVGVSLFAADLVHYVLGDKWEPAIVLLRAFGLTAAAGHIGFNWTAFYRARGDTRPIAVWSALTMLSFVAVPLPLLLTEGLTGYAIGMGVMTGVSLVVRGYYLARLFAGFTIARHAARAVAPTVPAVASVFLMRALEGSRSPALALAELAVYCAVTAVATLVFERALLAEVIDYLRRPSTSHPRLA
jgi:O-antigen/teichoic acid export membrane protein